MEFHQQLVEWLCRMLPGDFLLESSWNLASQTMQLLTVLHLVAIHCKGTVFVSMGKYFGFLFIIDFSIVESDVGDC
jgi:hypothetical protein